MRAHTIHTHKYSSNICYTHVYMNVEWEEKIIRELEANQADRLMPETQCVAALSSSNTVPNIGQ